MSSILSKVKKKGMRTYKSGIYTLKKRRKKINLREVRKPLYSI